MIIVLSLVFISLISAAYASDNSISDNNTSVLSADTNQTTEIISIEEKASENLTSAEETDDILTASLKNSYIDAKDEVTYDVIGQNFYVKLLTSDKKPVSNAKIKFTVDGKSYESKTDSNGATYFQIRLDDGQYKLTTKFAGNSQYKSCSKQTMIKINNTRVVGENLTSLQIQDILDNAKANNVIVFKGDVYENVSLIINKRLVLVGNGNTVLKSNSKNPIFEITGKSSSLTSVTGFNIQSGGDGIKIINSDYVTIDKNNISCNGNGIVAENVKYLEIDGNNILNNKGNGIVLAFANDCNIINNEINYNKKDGIALSKSNNVYIYYNSLKNNQNGISTSKEIDNIFYGDVPKNLHIGNNAINSNNANGIYLLEMGENLTIDSNTINSNRNNGIYIVKASNNMNITSNVINYNNLHGIEVSHLGSNNILYNSIYANSNAGIKFDYDYTAPKNQNIEFNVIYSNPLNEIDASETVYDHVIKRLEIGENWYGGFLNVCPKIKTNNINVSIAQVDSYLFNVTFYDSDSNIVSKLPSRVVSHRVNNGRSKSFVLYNGTGTFERDASDDDIIHVSIDMATFAIVYKFDDPNYLHLEYPPYSPHVRPIDDVGKPYPNLPRPGLLQDIADDPGDNGNDETPSGNNPGKSIVPGNGNGGTSTGNGISGNGNGKGYGNSKATGNTDQKTTQGNGTAIQNSGSNSNPANNVGQNSNNPTGKSGQPSESPNVIKQIIIDEEDVIQATGISLMILLILLTIAFYYREDIKEMQSKI